MTLLLAAAVERTFDNASVIAIFYFRAPHGTTTFAKVEKEPNGVPGTWRLLVSAGIVFVGRRTFYPFTRHEDTLYYWNGVVPPCRRPDDGVQSFEDSRPLFFQVLHSWDEHFDASVDGLSLYKNGETTMTVSYPDKWRARNARYWSTFTEGTRERIYGISFNGFNTVEVPYDIV